MAPHNPTAVVLLVEDESMVRDITAQVLRAAGYQVIEAGSPTTALKLLDQGQESIDLLLTDIVMPEMNGVELANRLLASRPGLAVVFMSGYAEHELSRKMRATSVRHVQKPFTVQGLLAQLSEALLDRQSLAPVSEVAGDQSAQGGSVLTSRYR